MSVKSKPSTARHRSGSKISETMSRLWPARAPTRALADRPRNRLGDVLLANEPDKPAVRGRDRRAIEATVGHDTAHLRHAHGRPVRGRTRTHGLLDQQVWVDVQLFGPEQPEHHQFGAHDHT